MFYIQSRYYRAPEIMLDLPYGPSIDIFSTGCMLAELLSGNPLFAGMSEHEQIYRLTEVLGIPPNSFISPSRRKDALINQSGGLKPYLDASAASPSDPNAKSRPRPRVPPIVAPGSRLLHEVLGYPDLGYDYGRLQRLPEHAFSVTAPEISLEVGNGTGNGYRGSQHQRQPPSPAHAHSSSSSLVYLYPTPAPPSSLHGPALLQWLVIDFIWSCIAWEPRRRMTAAQALRHPLMLRAYKYGEALVEARRVSEYVHGQAGIGGAVTGVRSGGAGTSMPGAGTGAGAGAGDASMSRGKRAGHGHGHGHGSNGHQGHHGHGNGHGHGHGHGQGHGYRPAGGYSLPGIGQR